MTGARWVVVGALLTWASAAAAVPPLVIGDVPTADRGTVEVYAGVGRVKGGAVEWTAPATEFVLGVSSWQELTLEVPYVVVDGGHGIGDLVLGTKIALVSEAPGRPGLAGSIEWKLPNGDSAAGLGSGSSEFGVLLRAQKTWGQATLIGNTGYTFVGDAKVAGASEPRRNVGFLGGGAEMELRRSFVALADLYWRSAGVPGEPARFAGDIGFKLRIADRLAILGAVGSSLRPGALGGPQLRVYLGLKGEASVF